MISKHARGQLNIDKPAQAQLQLHEYGSSCDQQNIKDKPKLALAWRGLFTHPLATNGYYAHPSIRTSLISMDQIHQS